MSHDQYKFIFQHHNMSVADKSRLLKIYYIKKSLQYEITKFCLAHIYGLIYRLDTAHVLVAKTSKHILEIFGENAENIHIAVSYSNC